MFTGMSNVRIHKHVFNLIHTSLQIQYIIICTGITTDIIANDAHLRILADNIMTDTITLANEDILWHRNMHPKGTYQLRIEVYVCIRV